VKPHSSRPPAEGEQRLCDSASSSLYKHLLSSRHRASRCRSWYAVVQRVEETLAAKHVECGQGGRTRVLDRPGKLAWRREGADSSDEGAGLGGGEGGDGPFRRVRDQQGNPVAMSDANGKSAQGEDTARVLRPA